MARSCVALAVQQHWSRLPNFSRYFSLEFGVRLGWVWDAFAMFLGSKSDVVGPLLEPKNGPPAAQSQPGR